jgi:hypothetical protein
MIHDLLRRLGAIGIEHYGIISMCLFGGVFIGVLVWAFAQKSSHLDYMARVALDNESENCQEGDPTHE